MAKIKRFFIETTFANNGSLRAEDIPYDGSNSVKAKIDAVGAPEGTAVLSTGEVGGTKFLREDGNGTSSWQSTDPYSIQRLVNTLNPDPILTTDGAILFDTTSTAITIDLPLASVGKITIPFKDIGANASVNNITINSVGGDTIVDIAVAQSSLEIAIDGFSAAMTSNGVDEWYVTYLSSVGGITPAQVDQLESLGYTVQRLVNTASPDPILTTDGAILFDTDNGTAISINLPAASVGKVTIPFKDIGGNAATNNITINRVGIDTIVDVAAGQISTVIQGDGFSGAFASNGVDTWYLTYGDFGGGGLDSAAVQSLIDASVPDQRPLYIDAGNKSGSVSIDGSTANNIELTATADFTDITITGLVVGQAVTLWINNSGAHAMAYASLIADDGTGTLANLDAETYPRVVCQLNSNSQIIASDAGIWRT